MNIFKTMLICLLLTIIIECLVAFILKIKDKKDYLNIILVNILTNPLVVSISTTILLGYGIKYKKISMIFLELFAFLTEGYIYKKVLKYKKINPYILSLILNLSSYLFGVLVDIII